MKGVLLFIFLAALVVCQHPESHEGKHEERIHRRKQIQKDISDCILKGDISTELKNKLEENKDKDKYLRQTIHLFLNKLGTKDSEVIKKCRREVFGKMRDMFKSRKFGNHTLEKKNETIHPSSAHASSKTSAAASAKTSAAK